MKNTNGTYSPLDPSGRSDPMTLVRMFLSMIRYHLTWVAFILFSSCDLTGCAMQVDKKQLGLIKEHIRQGFQWGAKEGPLCDERGFSLDLTHTRLLIITIQRCEG